MTRLGLIQWMKILRELRIWFQRADQILDLPDINDPEQVYTWCHMILVLAQESAKLTPFDIDDRVVAWLLAVPFSSFDEFKAYYTVFKTILELVHTQTSNEEIAARALSLASKDTKEKITQNTTGLDPIMLLTVTVQVIRLMLSLKK